jgi:hypothetical protein
VEARHRCGETTAQIESAHPEFGQLLRTARDPSVAGFRLFCNELSGAPASARRARSHRPSAPPTGGSLAAIAALLALSCFTNPSRSAHAFARLLAPFPASPTPGWKHAGPTFDHNRLPRIEARTGRPAKEVTVHVLNPEGGGVSLMNPLGGGR